MGNLTNKTFKWLRVGGGKKVAIKEEGGDS